MTLVFEIFIPLSSRNLYKLINRRRLLTAVLSYVLHPVLSQHNDERSGSNKNNYKIPSNNFVAGNKSLCYIQYEMF